jgi:hypothetical protein
MVGKVSNLFSINDIARKDKQQQEAPENNSGAIM